MPSELQDHTEKGTEKEVEAIVVTGIKGKGVRVGVEVGKGNRGKEGKGATHQVEVLPFTVRGKSAGGMKQARNDEIEQGEVQVGKGIEAEIMPIQTTDIETSLSEQQ